ncbi:hypothetical protein SSPIM334S_02184 [Streptomyces spiroverticillatus]
MAVTLVPARAWPWPGNAEVPAVANDSGDFGKTGKRMPRQMPQAAEDDPVEELDEDADDEDDVVDDDAAGFESELDEDDDEAVFEDEAGVLLDEEPRLSFR